MKESLALAKSPDNLSHDVLLVFPGSQRDPDPQIPLSLLHVASPLTHEGYKVKILDMRLENWQGYKIGDPIFVGISSMSGLQIRYALEFAKKVRAENTSCPIVWGGVHPSLLPEQTIASDFVDVVVRGEAESAIVNLAKNLESGRSLDNVEGITFKVEGKVKSNPDSRLTELDQIPVDLPYNLLPMERYSSFRSGRFHTQTSRGCPHMCGFCYNPFFNKRRWRGKSPERVLNEIDYILGKFPHVNCIDIVDDNFFVDRDRVESICAGMITKNIKVTWRANCRFDYLSRYDEGFINLLTRSGCVELDFGGETGSSRLLSMLQKEITTDQMIQSVDNLRKWGPTIEPYVSWMSGLPTETYEDLAETFNLMDKMREINSKTQHFGMFIYTPFPSPLMQLLGPGFKPPQSLEEWGDVDVFQFRPPWHSKKYVEMLRTISAVTRYTFYPRARLRERDTLYRFAYGAFNKIAMFRWRHRFFGFPADLRIVDYVAKRLRGFL